MRVPDDSEPEYDRQVFINCPFDDAYWPIFQAISFTIHACDFVPRCGLEASDATEERLAKIIRIIDECCLGIHDISRKTGEGTGNFARFSMPYEMGLFQGAASFGSRPKSMLILESHPFDYRRFLSDISGRDIFHHGNEPHRIISGVREWLHAQRIVKKMLGGQGILLKFQRFHRQLPKLLHAAKLHPFEIKFPHFLNWSELVQDWFDANRRGTP